MTDTFAALDAHLQQIGDLGRAASLLNWDMEVMMPPHAAAERGRMLATLAALRHAKATDPAFGELIDAARGKASDEWRKRDLDLLAEQYALDTQVPESLVYALKNAQSTCVTAWKSAKASSDWNAVLPSLRELFALARERAQIFASVLDCDAYDAQLHQFARGNTVAQIDPLFDLLKTQLPPLVQEIVDKQRGLAEQGNFTMPIDVQKRVASKLAQDLGFSYTRGRLDESAHPFSGGTDNDSRITTRFQKESPFFSLFGTIHEVGHALYNQNLPVEWANHPVGDASDLSLHESQSLIFEKQLGLSQAFLAHLHNLIVREDADYSVRAPLDGFIARIRTVRPSFIRTDADEATYPLHVILRYEIEKELFAGTLDFADLPEFWNARFKEYFGLYVPDHKNGCMQDVHWFWGMYGYFPTYTQGALYAAQLMDALRRDIPDLDAQLRRGDCKVFLAWLTDKIHKYGMRYDAPELIAKATGQAASADYFLDHLKRRYL